MHRRIILTAYAWQMPSRAKSRDKTQVVREFVARLEAVYGETPWVPRWDPMEELVATILSQHTSDTVSFPAFEKLQEKYPTWQKVVEAGPEKVAAVVKNAGLANQKSKSIVRCLAEVRERTGGYSIDFLKEMPLLDARKWLTSLPGVGPKTASIVLCFALGMPAVPVDTHVFRVSWRLGLIPENAGENKAHDLLLAIVPAELAFRFHMALLKHGRAVCKAPLPMCEICAVRELCWWFGVGGPAKKAKEMQKRRRAKA